MGTVNEQKFLVTWIQANGEIRGQAVKTKADGERMFHHLKSTDAQYIEVRKIGSVVFRFGHDTTGLQ